MSKFTEVLVARRPIPAEEKIKSTLDDASYKDFQEAMLDPTISAAAITRALKDLGVEISAMTIQRWRQK